MDDSCHPAGSLGLREDTQNSTISPYPRKKLREKKAHVLKKVGCSVTQSCPTLCNLMDCSTPVFPVLHSLPEFTKTHVHWIDDASNRLILCRLLLLPPSIFSSIRVFSNKLALCISWQSIWASASALVLQMTVQGWFPLALTALISLQSKRLSRVFSNTTVQKHQFFGAQHSSWSKSYIHTCCCC